MHAWLETFRISIPNLTKVASRHPSISCARAQKNDSNAVLIDAHFSNFLHAFGAAECAEALVSGAKILWKHVWIIIFSQRFSRLITTYTNLGFSKLGPSLVVYSLSNGSIHVLLLRQRIGEPMSSFKSWILPAQKLRMDPNHYTVCHLTSSELVFDEQFWHSAAQLIDGHEMYSRE